MLEYFVYKILFNWKKYILVLELLIIIYRIILKLLKVYEKYKIMSFKNYK